MARSTSSESLMRDESIPALQRLAAAVVEQAIKDIGRYRYQPEFVPLPVARDWRRGRPAQRMNDAQDAWRFILSPERSDRFLAAICPKDTGTDELRAFILETIEQTRRPRKRAA